jgi:hypothetical protein
MGSRKANCVAGDQHLRGVDQARRRVLQQLLLALVRRHHENLARGSSQAGQGSDHRHGHRERAEVFDAGVVDRLQIGVSPQPDGDLSRRSVTGIKPRDGDRRGAAQDRGLQVGQQLAAVRVLHGLIARSRPAGHVLGNATRPDLG